MIASAIFKMTMAKMVAKSKICHLVRIAQRALVKVVANSDHRWTFNNYTADAMKTIGVMANRAEHGRYNSARFITTSGKKLSECLKRTC